MSPSRKRRYGVEHEMNVTVLEKALPRNILLNVMKIHHRRINPIFAKT